MVNDYAVIFTSREEVGKTGVETDGCDIILMTRECLNASLGLVVPHTNSLKMIEMIEYN